MSQFHDMQKDRNLFVVVVPDWDDESGVVLDQSHGRTFGDGEVCDWSYDQTFENGVAFDRSHDRGVENSGAQD